MIVVLVLPLPGTPPLAKRKLYGEYLTNAQGEDVVAGIRTPKPIKEMAQEWPNTYAELTHVAALLEKAF